jgi:hypothetical protein
LFTKTSTHVICTDLAITKLIQLDSKSFLFFVKYWRNRALPLNFTITSFTAKYSVGLYNVEYLLIR